MKIGIYSYDGAFSGLLAKRNYTKRLLAKIYYSPQSKVSIYWCRILLEIELLPRGSPNGVPSMPKNL
jgi:hypothetical protein